MTHENYIKVQYVRDLLNLNESLFNFICDVQNLKEKIDSIDLKLSKCFARYNNFTFYFDLNIFKNLED